MSKSEIKDNKEIKTKKEFKDSFTNTQYKRPFILEKILKDLHSKRSFEYLNKNKDPLIKRKKELKKIKLPKNFKKLQKPKEDLKSRHNTPFLQLIPNLQNMNSHLNNRKINIPQIKRLNRHKSDLDLPSIYKYKLKNQSSIEEKTTMTFFDESNKSHNTINSKEEDKNQGSLITSEIMQPKDLFKNKSRKISVCTFLNKLPGDKSLHENYKIIKDVKDINEKYHLNLNLEPHKSNSTSNIFDGKKYNIYGMLNKLFQYYSSESNSNNYKTNKYTNSNYYKNSTSFIDTNENKKSNKFEQSEYDNINNTMDLKKNTYEDDSNTFLTKLNNYNISDKKEKDTEFNISKFIRKRCSLSDIKRNNKEVLENDKRIGIHCLLSKVQNEISMKKILYKYIDRTLYRLENDPMYKRVKAFEEIIEKILKNNY